jgi:protein-tyrosine-phosphatase
MASPPFKILYVCDGNDAPSAIAAACTERIVSSTDGTRWEVSSAGTHAIEGMPLRPEARAAAEALALDLSGHRSKLLHPSDCAAPDLILAMSWDQVSHIWSAVPEAWEKIFTIKEFVHWAKRAPVRPPILFADRGEQMRDKIVQAHAVRRRARADHGFWGGIRPQDLNLIEPNGKGDDAWRALGQAVHALVSDVITLLLATGDRAAPVGGGVAGHAAHTRAQRWRKAPSRR